MNEAEKNENPLVSPKDERMKERAGGILAAAWSLTKTDEITRTDALLAMLIAEIDELSESVLPLQDMTDGLENVLNNIGSDLR